MAIKGDDKRAYQKTYMREYMRKKRAGEARGKAKGKPASRANAAPVVDTASLPKSGQAKVAAAIRQLQADYAKRMRVLDEEINRRVVEEGKEYLAMLKEREAKTKRLEEWIRVTTQSHKPILTIDEYKLVAMCVHPDGDRSPEKRNEAFQLLESKKFYLTGKK